MVERARAFDLRAHFDQQFGEIGDFRLERAIFENGFAFGQHRRGENIFRAGHGDFREAESGAAQTLGARFHVAVLDVNFRAEFFERLNVQVDGARADGAAAGKRNARVAEARHERAEREHRSAHRFHEFVGRFGVRNRFGLDREFAGRQVRAFHLAAHVREKLGHGDDVAHVRNIFQRDGFVVSSAAAMRGQRGIFRAADSDRAFELASAVNFESVHAISSFLARLRCFCGA